MPKVIGIVGTRRRDSNIAFMKVEEAFLKVYEEGDKICSGLCPTGADRFAVVLAQLYNVKTIWHAPNWERYGKGAGFVRNSLIARDSDILIACVAKDRRGGTEDTIKKYLGLGKKKLILVE